jgi:hypothetical protein
VAKKTMVVEIVAEATMLTHNIVRTNPAQYRPVNVVAFHKMAVQQDRECVTELALLKEFQTTVGIIKLANQECRIIQTVKTQFANLVHQIIQTAKQLVYLECLAAVAQLAEQREQELVNQPMHTCVCTITVAKSLMHKHVLANTAVTMVGAADFSVSKSCSKFKFSKKPLAKAAFLFMSHSL